MGRHKKHEEHVNHERWLISYADFITLLFAFFVVMFSTSQVNQNRLQAFSESFAGAMGESIIARGSSGLLPAAASTPPTSATVQAPVEVPVAFSLEGLSVTLRAALARDPTMASVQLVRRRSDFVLRMSDRVFFESGASAVKEGAAIILATLARTLGGFPIDLRVEGHTDRNPIRTSRYRSNWELSTARATSVLEVLAAGGFPPDRLSASGYAEFHPVADNDTDDGRQQNRRVDLVVSLHSDPNRAPDDGGVEEDPVTAIRAAMGDAGAPAMDAGAPATDAGAAAHPTPSH